MCVCACVGVWVCVVCACVCVCVWVGVCVNLPNSLGYWFLDYFLSHCDPKHCKTVDSKVCMRLVQSRPVLSWLLFVRRVLFLWLVTVPLLLIMFEH